MAEVPFRPVRQLSEYKGKGASASREVIVNKGTLEPKKRHWKLSLHQILQVVGFSGFKRELCGC